jgi:hypothetical protein
MKIFQILRKKSTACKQWSTGRLEIYWKAWLIDYFLYFNLFIWPIWIIYMRAPLNKWSLSEREDTFFLQFFVTCMSFCNKKPVTVMSEGTNNVYQCIWINNVYQYIHSLLNFSFFNWKKVSNCIYIVTLWLMDISYIYLKTSNSNSAGQRIPDQSHRYQ